MPTRSAGLTARKVETLKEPGYHGDGGGLYLQVVSTGAKTWIYRFQIAGRRREMGIGSYPLIPLVEARAKAADARKFVTAGIDPIEQRNAVRAAARAETARGIPFRECAATYIDDHKAEWKSAKSSDQWTSSLKTYANPVFGDLPVGAVTTELVMKVIKPIWTTKHETASRVRQRIESILDWAKVNGYRDGENPARLKGHLDHLLPERSKVRAVVHHAALPYREMSNFFIRLQAADGVSPRALEYAILTAARTNEVLGAKWPEIDLERAQWVIPAGRMKGGKEHRIPLSDPALALLRKQHSIRLNEFVFPGMKPDSPLSNMALLTALDRMGRGELTAHGFRSTFRTWAAEQTSHPREVCEHALAHSLPDKVEASYQHGDLFDKRRRLMDDWAAYCTAPSTRAGNVRPIRGDMAVA